MPTYLCSLTKGSVNRKQKAEIAEVISRKYREGTGAPPWHRTMTRFKNLLASVALATALTPIAANAVIKTPPNQKQAQIVAHKAMSGPLPEVGHAAYGTGARGLMGQTIVQTGAANQRYPDSSGG